MMFTRREFLKSAGAALAGVCLPQEESSFPFIEKLELDRLSRETLRKYRYPNFLYPVSLKQRLPKDFPEEECELETETFQGKKVAACAAPYLERLSRAAKAAGFDHAVTSAFRSIEYQRGVFAGNISREKASGCDDKQAIIQASKYSAPPGYSEHHLGLAVDIRAKNAGTIDSFDRARQEYNQGFYQWLRDNVHKYGFVLSYPALDDTDDVSQSKQGCGYESCEPWHLRFVGKELAQYLFDRDYLKDNEVTLNAVLIIMNEISHS